MKIVIPLAGMGTRLRPHTFTKPKPLINVAGKPVLAHILDKLAGLSVEEIIFVTGMLGQAHAIALTKAHVSGPILIIFVDTIFDADLSELERMADDGLLYVKQVDDPRRFGVTVVEDGYIARLVEKPQKPVSNLAVVGVYYFKDAGWLMNAIETLMARNIKTGGEYYLADAIQLMIDEGAKLRAEMIDVWEDCGNLETLLHTNRYLLDHGRGNSRDCASCVLVPPVYIAPSATLENCVVGPHVSVADDAIVRDSIIRDSIINDRARVENATLSGSVVGADSRVQGRFNTLNVGDSSEVRFEAD
jgi:glucose-1-phosphate thymidylyltransferase